MKDNWTSIFQEPQSIKALNYLLEHSTPEELEYYTRKSETEQKEEQAEQNPCNDSNEIHN